MPIYTRQYAEVFENARAAEDAVRRYLALVETDLRETSLLAMASWQDAGIPRDLWKPALPNLFRVAAGLQEPSFGQWNGMLHALRRALACVGTGSGSRSITEFADRNSRLAGRPPNRRR